jgi:polyhydroxyalkanoate synthesis regulator phasin
MVQQAQQQQPPVESAGNKKPAEPRLIEIVSEEEEVSPKDAKEVGGVDKLREQVQNLQDELRRLKRD